MIAVLGATGYIGRSLACLVAAQHDGPLELFARDPSRLADRTWPGHVRLSPIAAFDAGRFDLVINAVGAGDPARVASLGAEILDVTQTWDGRVLATMAPRTRYVFLSSGAVYGTFAAPAREDSELRLPVNRLACVPPYTIAKLAAEARHRHAPGKSILDLRVFGYADPPLPTTGRSLLAELAHSVAERAPFATSPDDLVRDYAGAPELWQLIRCWLDAGAPNRALDLFSRAPVGKHDLLARVAERYGIEIRTVRRTAASPTGTKPVYVSQYRAAAEIGYAPTRTALEIVLGALDALAPAR